MKIRIKVLKYNISQKTNIKVGIFRVELTVFESVGSDIELLLFNKYRQSTKYCITGW